jgi:type I restriction enzyme M protein
MREYPFSGEVELDSFLERCLALLELGGRLGIVLREGIFNHPSLAYMCEFVDDSGGLL